MEMGCPTDKEAEEVAVEMLAGDEEAEVDFDAIALKLMNEDVI